MPGKELRPQEITQFQALSDTVKTRNSAIPKNSSESVSVNVWEFNSEPSTALLQSPGPTKIENKTEDPLLPFIITVPDETTSDIITDTPSAFFVTSTSEKNTGKLLNK